MVLLLSSCLSFFRRKTTEVTCNELPEQLWESILILLAPDAADDYHYLQSPSLVCKQFLSITDRLRRKLVAKSSSAFYSNNCEALCRAFQRFPNIDQIEFSGDQSDIDYPLRKIVDDSGWDLRSLGFDSVPNPPSAESFRRLASTMENLKVLRFRDVFNLCDQNLVAISDALPLLEELDIGLKNMYRSYRTVTDAGIEAVSGKLTRLRTIDISGHMRCSDRSLVALSSNCVLLNQIQCIDCSTTERGVCYVLGRCPNLTFLRAGCDPSRLLYSWLTIEDSVFCAGALRVLDLRGGFGNLNRVLCYIGEAGIIIPLEELVIRHAFSHFSFHGLSALLRASSPTLQHLKLFVATGVIDLNDDSMRYLCRYLPNLVSVELVWCPYLTMATLFILAKACPKLEKITLKIIEGEDGQVGGDFSMDMERNHRITYVFGFEQ